VFDRARGVAHTEFVEAIGWLVTAVGGVLLAVLAFALNGLVNSIGHRLDDLRDDMKNRFDTLDAHMGERFDAINIRFDDVNRRFDDVNIRFDDVNRRIDDLGGRMDNLDSRLNNVEANLAAAYKDIGEILGWVRAHGPIGGTHDPIAAAPAEQLGQGTRPG
jgi:hypothetical protein